MAVAELPPQKSGPRLPRWAMALLFVSLAANVLILGALAGAFVRHGPGIAMFQQGQPEVAGYLGTLAPDRRREILSRTGGRPRQQMAPLRREVRAAAEMRNAALAAEPFDRQQFLAAQTRVTDAETRLRTFVAGVVADTAEQMTVDERRAFARWRGIGRRGERPEAQDNEPGEPRPRR